MNKNPPAVILAAGKSTRMGFPKLLMAKDGKPLIKTMVENLRAAGWGEIGITISDISLAGFIDRRLPDVDIIFNRVPYQGMIGSIRLGMGWVGGGAEGMLTLPVDHPLISRTTFSAIIQAIDDSDAIVPTHKGRRGHPTWWRSSIWNRLMGEEAKEGARGVLRMDEVNVRELAVDDEAILWNVNTPEDLERFGLGRIEIDG